MTSAVDATIPAANTKSIKAEFRAQFLVIKNEITALQQRTSVAGAKAFLGFVDQADLENEVRKVHNETPKSYARDIAYGRLSITTL